MGVNAELITYFTEIATNLKAIGHTAQDPRFFRTELDEFMSSFNLAGKSTCLLLESSDYSMDNPSPDNFLKKRSVAFMVIKHCEREGDYNAIADIFDSTEEIIDEIIRKIWYDTIARGEAAFLNVRLTSVSVQPVENFVDFNYGQRAVVEMLVAHDETPDPTKWKDGYLTLDPNYVGDY